MMSSCPFCMRPGKNVNAHIIPKAFFEDISEDGSVLKQRELGQHPRRIPIGVYDDQIWCQSCEVEYGKWDKSAISVWRTPIKNFVELPSAYELKVDNLDELRLFFISLVWRASASKQRLFNKISLGEFSNFARLLLESSSPGSINNFSTIIHYSGKDDLLIAEPGRVRHFGILFYRFYLGRFIADIKVSSRPIPAILLPAAIGHRNDLVILRTPRDERLVGSASKIAEQLINHPTGHAR